MLALFPLAKPAHDGNTKPEPTTGGIRFNLGVQGDSAEEGDLLNEQLRAAGARLTKEPVDAEFLTGRLAYLCDPEGNYFEIVWADMPNPVVIATGRAADLWPHADRSAPLSSAPLLVVHVAPMSKPHDDHQQHLVLDCVDDSVIAYPDAKTGPALKRTCTWRTRFLGEQRDCTLNPPANLRVELAQSAECRRTELDAIRAHSQPRSALTCSHGMFGPSSAVAVSKAATSSASSQAVISCS